MLTKLRRRREPDSRAEATEWAASRAIEIEDFCTATDPVLWSETLTACAEIDADGRRRIEAEGVELGGGGAYPLLHFLVRLRRPEVVVETGVAAGWSSRAVLAALETNKLGSLWSSDFPYFRLRSPERLVGLVVPEELKGRWHLDVRGDEVALPQIVRETGKIDLFHFDSDKSIAGRQFAMETVSPQLSERAIVIMDDIQDNLFFRDWSTQSRQEPTIFRFEGKYLGAFGLADGE
jgi:predicted O-methyltransferase YrrM